MVQHIGRPEDFEGAARNSRLAGCFELAQVYAELAHARAGNYPAHFRGLQPFHTHTFHPSQRDRLLGTHWHRNGTRGSFHHEAADWVRSGRAACGASIKNPAYTISSPAFGQTALCRSCLSKLERV